MRIFYDVDTQNDFMNQDGKLYVPDAENLKPNLKLLTACARENRIPVLGSIDRHFGTEEYKEKEGELAKNGGPFPEHCMDGTYGQEKIDETRLGYDYRFGDLASYIPNSLISENYLQQAPGIFENNLTKSRDRCAIYFEKQSYDVFTNPNFAEFLKRAQFREAVVYGVATDFCVRAAVLGMQERGIQCYVVEDAITGVFPEKTKEALEEMVKAGAKFVKTKQVLEGKVR